MKKLLLLTISVFLALGAFAQAPNGSGSYYKNADGKKGSALKTALYSIISKKTTGVGYSYDGLLEDYELTDKRADGYLRDWYSHSTEYVIGGPAENKSYKKEGDAYNREHLVPQSWFGSGDPKSDIVHVVPSDGYVNNRRSNYPLADVKSATYTSNDGCKLGTCATPGYNGTVFEPLPDTKGDIARIYFYMATRYENLVSNWDGATASIVFAGNKYPAIKKWYLKMLFKWANDDPVDDIEIARNNAIYSEKVQKNRNPFVDYPGLEQYIWGNSQDVPFSFDNYQQPQYTGDGDISVEDDSGSGGEEQGGEGQGGDEQGSETPENATIALNNAFFDCSYSGSIDKNNDEDLIGTQNGITVTYSLGDGGANRYCNDSQIRLYQNNTFTVSVGQGTITKIEFELATTSSKTLSASTGTVNGLTWTGNAKSVVFTVNSGSGNMQIKNIKVTVSVPSGIHHHLSPITSRQETYNLKGQRVKRYGRGIYVKNGKKIIIH